MRKIPMRKCVVTQERFPKKELLRVVRQQDGTVVYDPTGKLNGRGAYLKKSQEVIELAKKKKILNRVLEVEVSEDVFKVLLELCNE